MGYAQCKSDQAESYMGEVQSHVAKCVRDSDIAQLHQLAFDFLGQAHSGAKRWKFKVAGGTTTVKILKKGLKIKARVQDGRMVPESVALLSESI